MKKKLLFIIPTLTQGGAEQVIITLLNHLDKDKFSLSLMVINMQDEVYSAQIPTYVNLMDLKSRHVRTAIPKIVFNIWKYSPDIVMSTIGYLNLAIGMCKFLMPPKVKFFARETIVVSERLARARFSNVWRFWYRFYYPRFEKVICQSIDMYKDLGNVIGEDQNLVLINNPVDLEKIQNQLKVHIESRNERMFFNKATDIHFVAAGRLIDQKGFSLLINAIGILASPRVKLAILGHGPLRVELQNQIESLNLQDSIFLMGYQKNPYTWIDKANAYILSSHYEGFPNVVLEALACRTQVLSTPAPGGAREILDKINGCYVAERIDAHSLADAMSLFIATGEIPLTSKAIEPYKIEKIIDTYTTVLLGKEIVTDQRKSF